MRAILLVDHGSRVAAANRVVEDVAAELRTSAEEGTLVAFAHQEMAAPSIGEAIDGLVAAGASELVVVPFFLAPGRHATEDVPRLAREAAARHVALRLEVVPPPLPASPAGLAAITLARLPARS